MSTKAIKSLKFQKAKIARARGYWKGITASEGIKYTIHVGITSTDSKTDKKQQTDALQKSVQNGWHAGGSVSGGANFGFASVSATVEGGADGSTTNDTSSENQAAQEIANVSGMDQQKSYETTCMPADGVAGAGIWQWVIATEDHSVTAFTDHTVCKTGDDAIHPPKCSWWDC